MKPILLKKRVFLDFTIVEIKCDSLNKCAKTPNGFKHLIIHYMEAMLNKHYSHKNEYYTLLII